MTTRRNFELRLLLPLLISSALAWAFIKVAEEVVEGQAHAVDQWVLEFVRGGSGPVPDRPVALTEIARDLTALGSPSVLVLVNVAAWLTLMLARRQAMAWMALASSLGGMAATFALKSAFSRTRPDEIYRATIVSGYSFPSGHAMMSAVVFLTLAMLAARLTERTSLRVCAVLIAGLCTGLVGLTRVYLGVHWTSDVVAGWMAGAAWAALCWALADHLRIGQETSR